MAGRSFFIDTTRCTACRGCQIACNNWNRNGASMTKITGSHQNPPDLDGNTFKLVRFSEVETAGKVAWYFFADQCRHCLEPPCKDAIEGYVKDGVVLDEATGAVVRVVPFGRLYGIGVELVYANPGYLHFLSNLDATPEAIRPVLLGDIRGLTVRFG